MDRTNSLIAAGITALFLLLLIGGLWFILGQRQAVQPPPEPSAQAETTAPSVPADTEVASQPPATPSPIVQQRPPGQPNPAPPPPSDPMAEFRVEPFTGLVIDAETNQPIPDAVVTSYLFDSDAYRLAENYPAQLEVTTSDVFGGFEFADTEVAANETLAWRAVAPGYSSTILLYPGGKGQGDKLRCTFLLKSTAAIEGTVVDESGAPIANAIVGGIVITTGGDKPGTGGEWALPSFWAVSSTDGSFELEGGSFGDTYRLPARAEGYIATVTSPVGPGATAVTIQLVRAESGIAGTVTDHTGAPASDALVEIAWKGSRFINFDRLSLRTRTNSNGEFQISSLPSGPFEIVAQREQPDALGLGERVEMSTVLIPGEDTKVDLQLPAPVTINGKFVDFESGAGVGGVIIYSNIDEVNARNEAAKVQSDERGFFNFTAYVPDYQRGYEVRLPVEFPEGYFAREARDDDSRGVVVEQDYISFPAVRPGDQRTALINLERGHKLTGRVIEPDGSEPGFELPVFLNAPGFYKNVSTLPDGTFEIYVPSDRALRIESSSENGIANDVFEPGGLDAVELRLLRYAQVSGVVLDPSGDPLPEMFIEVTRPQNDEAFDPAIRFEERDQTGDTGEFDIEKVGPDDVFVSVRLAGASEYTRPKPVRLELSPGEHRDDVVIRLESGAEIAGKVVDADTGDPLSGVTLTTDRSEIAASTDEDGNFALKGLAGNSLLAFVTASKPGYSEETRQNVSIRDREIVFRLKERGDLTVSVTGGGGGVENFQLRLLRDAPDQPGDSMAIFTDRYVTNSDGSVLLEDIPPGEYRAEVSEILGDGGVGARGAEDFTFAPTGGNGQTITVELEGNLVLRGAVSDGVSGAPVAGATVELLNPPLGMVEDSGPPSARKYQVRTGGDGTFQIPELPEGSYVLRASFERSVSGKLRFRLTAESDAAELTLQPAPRIFGRIYGADADPIREAILFFIPESGTPDGEALQVRGGDYERFLSGPGDWQIAVTDEVTGDTTTRYVSVEAGEEREVNIDFSNRISLTGTITIDGEPAPSTRAIRLLSFEGREALLIPEDATGSYNAKVFPGDYFAWYDNGNFQAPLPRLFGFAAKPETQNQDFSVSTGSLTIQLVGADASGGSVLSMECQVEGQAVPLLQEWSIDRPVFRFFDLPAGAYRGTFFRNGTRIGESSWVSVPAGQEVVMTVEVDP